MYNYSHYLKKTILKDFEKMSKKKADIPKILSTINNLISGINDEVHLFSRGIKEAENKFGKNDRAAEASTIFPFLDYSILDILILHKQYLCATDSIEKKFICRTAALHMYEFLEDGSKALGKTMNDCIGTLNDQTIDIELKALRKSFNDLKIELHEPLQELRNNVSGHKDRDIRNQLLISDKIDIVDFHRNFLLFIFFYFKLIKFKKSLFDKKLRPISTKGKTNTLS